MSYESQLDPQSGKLINPTQLCLLLSVVLHLLVLKFGFPTFKFNNDDGKREVSIIELDAEQQARLPDLEPQLKTSDLASLSNPANLPPNLLPGNTDPSSLPPLIIPPPPQSNFPPLPPITDITLPPVGNWSQLPLPPQLDPSDFQVEPIKLPPNLGKVPQPTKSSAVKTPPNPSTTAKLENPPQKQPETKPQTKPETEPETKPKDTPEIIAAQKLAASQQRIASLRQSITLTKEGTTDEEARKNYVVWLAKIKDAKPENIKIKGTYPRDACIVKLKGSNVFGVVVNAKGQVVNLDLLKGSKYPIFNQQANQDLRSRLFKNDTNKPKPYQVEVNYEYDPEICPSLTLPSIGTQEKQSPQPASKPTPAPTVQPKPKPKPAPATQPKPVPTPKPESKPTPAPTVQPKPKPEPAPATQPEPAPPSDNSAPSLGDRLRDIPLPDLDPDRLKNVPLPKKPDL